MAKTTPETDNSAEVIAQAKEKISGLKKENSELKTEIKNLKAKNKELEEKTSSLAIIDNSEFENEIFNLKAKIQELESKEPVIKEKIIEKIVNVNSDDTPKPVAKLQKGYPFVYKSGIPMKTMYVVGTNNDNDVLWFCKSMLEATGNATIQISETEISKYPMYHVPAKRNS